MKFRKTGLGTLIFAGVIGSASADYPVSLHFDEPNSNADTVWLSESGWGVTLKMVVRDEDMLGIAKLINWPNKGGLGFIVLEDPDGCPWMDDEDWRGWFPPPGGCPLDEESNVPDTVVEDETYLEFRPDVDMGGVPDNSGDKGEQAELTYFSGDRAPEFGNEDMPGACVPGTSPTGWFGGQVNAADPGGTTLIDHEATFLSTGGLNPGDAIVNQTDGSTATVISVDSQIQITHTALSGGTDNEWQVVVIAASGMADVEDTNGEVLVDNDAAFITDGVAANDWVFNRTDGSRARILSVDSETQITHNPLIFGADDEWGVGDSYEIETGVNDSYRVTATNANCARPGPYTGGAVVDGWGFGSDDDLPGLFLYTNVGVGLVWDEPNFELTDPVGYRNLAGLLNSVTYELSDLTKFKSKGKGEKGPPTETYEPETRVWGHLNMPAQVVRNIIQYDACTGEILYTDPPDNTSWDECSGDDAWRIDGGFIEIPPQKFTRADAASIWQLENSVFTLHAFLVSGHAPDELFDANGDGDLTDDAEAAGLTVISNVDSIDLIQFSNRLCWGGGGNAYLADLDGNGEATVPIVCGPGPGDIGRPPR